MFAVVLTLCTYAACNDYYVDHASTKDDCMQNLVVQADNMAIAWHHPKRLSAFLKGFNIDVSGPVTSVLQDYDYTCEFIPDSEIP